ncbi:YceI family protein [uncultured Thiodictyon sp.]|jgi:polyisoprenoid-binding protein YceI|uniref:YceI family protein n=1 Tax=uncultured Thiodictyon sp. TaxID=1846217 RepID=UPI0025DF0567|nr:YceI family protein [uncultured Thiodictyon sp.]
MLALPRNRLTALASALPGLLLALGLGSAQALEFNQVQADQSKVSFVSRQMGVPVAGTFAKFSGTLAFDPAQPTLAAARVAIDRAGIDAGSQEANDEVVGKQWLNVKAFPSAQFVATSVEARGEKGYTAVGKLTIKGQTREVRAPFSFRQEGNTGVFDGGFVLKRLDFGIGEGPWSDVSTVADEIEIRFHVVATAAKQ